MQEFCRNDLPIAGTREALRELAQKRDALEEEISSIAAELTSAGINGAPPPGIRGPLIDQEGYPRGDIDIYEIRLKRQQLNCLQNDHRVLMTQIEDTLLRYHAELRVIRQDTTVTSAANNQLAETTLIRDDAEKRCFAIVDEVSEGSPASSAGLKVGDLILSFGSVTEGNHRNLAAVADIVRANLQRPVEVLVRRENGNTLEEKKLVLVPKPWSGQGLLG